MRCRSSSEALRRLVAALFAPAVEWAVVLIIALIGGPPRFEAGRARCGATPFVAAPDGFRP